MTKKGNVAQVEFYNNRYIVYDKDGEKDHTDIGDDFHGYHDGDESYDDDNDEDNQDDDSQFTSLK